MKMENPRVAFLEPEFTPMIRTSSDPNQLSARRIRGVKSLPNARSLSTSPESRKLDVPKSPQLQKLTRADSYRAKPKQNPMVTTSNLERRKKTKERRRLRSQSSPMFPQDLDITDPNLGKTMDSLSNESLKEDDTQYKSSPLNGRKKSFSALKEMNIKKFIETNKPKLKRSQSQRFAEKPVIIKQRPFATDDDDSDDGPKKPNAPLFQATTLFVPGYDFRTKSKTLPNTTTTTRKVSTPQLPRRSSKERMSVFFDKVITRQTSTPCLLKRDSKEKMKKIEQHIEERIIETPYPDEITDTPPPTIMLNNRANNNERVSSSPEQSNDDVIVEPCVVKQRKAAIALRQKKFREKGTTKSLDCTLASCKVKQIASGYDHGTAYVKVRNLVNKTSELSLKDNSNTCEYDTKDNEVDKMFEKVYDVDNRPSRSHNGTESGYASLTDSMNLEKEIFANSWSHNDWRDSDDFSTMALPAPRAFNTDLCVTEL